MQRIIIFANGTISQLDTIRQNLRADDYIIAADNGAAHCARLKITPQVIIGDMDSISQELLEKFERAGAVIICHPAEKNETDLELALLHAASIAVREILVFGIAGDRWDMTLANALMLAHPALRDISVRSINGSEELTVIHAGHTATIHGSPGDSVSLIPLSDPTEGITLEGFRYPLKNENLPLGSGRGVSNELASNTGLITITRGVLLCVITG